MRRDQECEKLLMLANSTVCKLVIKRCLFVLALLAMGGICGIAQAESGSSQATMALIVLPHDMANTDESQPDPSTMIQPLYNHETSIHFIRQIDGNPRQVWVTL